MLHYAERDIGSDRGEAEVFERDGSGCRLWLVFRRPPFWYLLFRCVDADEIIGRATVLMRSVRVWRSPQLSREQILIKICRLSCVGWEVKLCTRPLWLAKGLGFPCLENKRMIPCSALLQSDIKWDQRALLPADDWMHAPTLNQG